MLKQQDSIISVLLRSPMRVVAMRIHWHVTLFHKLYHHLNDHPLHQYQHASRTTFNHPNLDFWEWDTPICHTKLRSHLPKWQWAHKPRWASCHCHGKHLVWNFQMEGKSTHSCPTCSVHNYGSFHEHVWHYRVKVVFQTLPPRNQQYKPSVVKENLSGNRPTSHIAWIRITGEKGGGT